MDPNSFEVTAWNNGAWHETGAGYGLKISVEDRDTYFDRDWDTVTLRLVGKRTSSIAGSCPGAWCKSVALYAAPGG